MDSAKAALEADPNLAGAYNNLVVSYLKLGMFDEAEHAANEAIRLLPDDTLARNNLAWIQREKTRPTSYSQAARSAEADALVAQSGEHAGAGRYEACVDAAGRALLLQPGSSGAFNNKGFCEGNLLQWDAAVQDLEEATRLAPDVQLYKNNLGWAQQEKLKAQKPAASRTAPTESKP